MMSQQKVVTRRSNRRWNEFIEEAEESGLMKGKVGLQHGSDSWRDIFASEVTKVPRETDGTNRKGDIVNEPNEKQKHSHPNSGGKFGKFKFNKLKPDFNFHSLVEFVGNHTRRRISSTKAYQEFDVLGNDSADLGYDENDDDGNMYQRYNEEWNDAAQRLLALQLDSTSPNCVAALFNPNYTELPHSLEPLSKGGEETSETFSQDGSEGNILESGRPLETEPSQDAKCRQRRPLKEHGRRRSARSFATSTTSASTDTGASSSTPAHPIGGGDSGKTDTPSRRRNQRARRRRSSKKRRQRLSDPIPVDPKCATSSGSAARGASMPELPSHGTNKIAEGTPTEFPRFDDIESVPSEDDTIDSQTDCVQFVPDK